MKTPKKLASLARLLKPLERAGCYEFHSPTAVPEFITGLNDAIDQTAWIRRKRHPNAAVALHAPEDGKVKAELKTRKPRGQWQDLGLTITMPEEQAVRFVEATLNPKR